MECRADCGACCIAPSISAALPGMPRGKPAGVPCVNLDMATRLCALWGSDNYPALCERFAPEPSVCGNNAAEALRLIGDLECATASDRDREP